MTMRPDARPTNEAVAANSEPRRAFEVEPPPRARACAAWPAGLAGGLAFAHQRPGLQPHTRHLQVALALLRPGVRPASATDFFKRELC